MATHASAREGNSSKKPAVFELHEKHRLQEKALQKWEKQKHVWATVQENIRRRVADGSTAHKACMNMSQGCYQTRVREEDIGLIANVTPSSVFTGFHTWQSTLRVSESQGAVRYLQVGKTSFPYALYGKVTDKRRQDVEHPINTRIVFPGQDVPDVASDTQLGRPATDTLSVSHGGSEYYKERLQKLLPQIQKKAPHLLLPRSYLEVCGQLPPWTTNPDDAAAARNSSVPAVMHVQPPPPRSDQQKGPESGRRTSRPTSAGEAGTRAAEGAHPIISETETLDKATEGVLTLDISTTRVLFVAKPGELAHSPVRIKNTGTVTVYYTWTSFQPTTALDSIEEISERCEEAEGDGDGDSTVDIEQKDNSDSLTENGKSTEEEREVTQHGTDGSNDDNKDVEIDMKRKQHEQTRRRKEEAKTKTCKGNVPLRSLAKKSAESKSFFFLSAELNGVILPGDEKTFSFSVRAAFPGRFTQHYELFMIPAVSSRVIIELCAIVRDGGPPLEAVSRPIAEALDAKAAADVQRGTINALAANENIFEAVEIERATQECIAAAKAPEEAQEALVVKWRKAWLASTFLAMRIPFNRAVYERLDALYQNLARTMSALGQPLHHKEWDGSMQTLQCNICMLRDAPSRNMLREAINVLLRAATVSEHESELLDSLLQRAAGTIALSTLARRTGELDDTITVGVGAGAPRTSASALHAPNSPRSVGAAGNTFAGRKGGSSSNHISQATGAGKSHGSLSRTRGANLLADVPPERGGGNVEKPGAPGESLGANDPAMDALVKEEYRARLFTGMRRVVGDAVDRFCSTLDSFRCVIEAACALPLLEMTARMRANDIGVIQSATEMEVDFAMETAPQKKKR